jgi:nitric-oxide synthase, plant
MTAPKLTDHDTFSQVGVTLTPPTGKERAEEWVGLEGVCELKIKYEDRNR